MAVSSCLANSSGDFAIAARCCAALSPQSSGNCCAKAPSPKKTARKTVWPSLLPTAAAPVGVPGSGEDEQPSDARIVDKAMATAEPVTILFLMILLL
ncbi:MAG TPA: hypothetical protein VK655_10835 [Solirubrobacteraceae bacterium]|nr:hypothetical protein [Solirubrobacteraceae bacterium]